MAKRVITAAVCVFLALPGSVSAGEFEVELTALARGRIAEIVSAPMVVDAVRAQNVETAGYDQARIDAIDRIWRDETESGDQPMIDEVMERPLSLFLLEMQDASDGLFTEIFVMDARGLNVGQSKVTSDYWQGDEAKWRQTFGAGPGGLHIGALEEDDSTQTVQSQVSVAVVDPLSGKAIGAATFGVNVEKL